MTRFPDWFHRLSVGTCPTALATVAVSALMIGSANAVDIPFSVSVPTPGSSAYIDLPPPGFGFSFTLPDFGPIATIVDLNVHMTIEYKNPQSNDTDLFWTDLEIVLEHGGTSVMLQPRDPDCQGPSCASPFDVTYDDEAAAKLLPFTYAVGDFQPEEALSTFDGQDLSGPWTLTFTDWTGSIPDPGAPYYNENYLITLDLSGVYDPPPPPPPSSSSTTSSVPEPGTLAMFGLGLAGIGFLRRRRSV